LGFRKLKEFLNIQDEDAIVNLILKINEVCNFEICKITKKKILDQRDSKNKHKFESS